MSTPPQSIRVSASRLKTLNLSSFSHWKTRIVCLVGVYGYTMYIYLVTCLVNGKFYVGRTTRSDPRRRWSEHCCAARKGRECGIIARAIRKHGENAFTFEVIEKVDLLENLPEREAYWIAHYDSLSPKGYNLETYQPNRVCSPELSERLSRSQQGRKKRPNTTSQYVGVHRNRHSWIAMLTYQGTDYVMWFRSEKEAAIAYDKLARYIVGNDARVNFPEAVYSAEELAATHAAFTAPVITSSQYRDVYYSASIGKWKGVVELPNGGSRVRVTDNESEAAQFVDIIRLLYLGSTQEQLNFPHLYSRYQQIDEEWIKRRAYISPTKGLTKRDNRYHVRLGSGGSLFSKAYRTEEEARNVLVAKRKELGMTWDL